MDNRVGTDCGTGGAGRAKGENWDNCSRTTIKYLIKKKGYNLGGDFQATLKF